MENSEPQENPGGNSFFEKLETAANEDGLDGKLKQLLSDLKELVS